MKLSIGILIAAVVIASPLHQVVAADSMHSSAMMPKCPPGDAVVSVDMKTKTYMPVDKSHMMMSGAHKGNEMSNDGMMKNHMSTLCKSKADAMGAHMMKGKGQM